MVSHIFILDQNLKNLIGHYFEYDRSVAEAAIRRGCECTVLAHEAADLPAGLPFDIQPIYTVDIWGTQPGANFHDTSSIEAMGELFAKETLMALRRMGRLPGKGDVVFFPTITKNQMPGVAMLAEKFASDGASIKVMLRYQKALMDGVAAEAAYKRLEAIVRKGGKVTLCSDSHRLGAELSALTTLPIETYPIPHTEHVDEEDRIRPRPQRRNSDTLSLVSLGNARGEKGLAEILDAVRLTEKEPWARKLRFFLQANDPSDDIVDALAAYRRRPDPRVTLIDKVMSSEDYSSLLESADTVLTPYHRDIYRERTSGVFLEGLTAGKVVVGTEDTWMGDLLALHRGGIAVQDRNAQSVADALHSIASNFEEYQARADVAAKVFRETHTPENLLRHLLDDDAVPIPLARARKAVIIYPWGDGAVGQSGAGLRLRLLTQYLERFYLEVRILFSAQGEKGGMLTERTPADPYYYMENEPTRQLYDRLARFAPKVGGSAADIFHLWHHMWPKSDERFRERCADVIDWADDVFLEYSYFAPVVAPLCKAQNKRLFVTQYDVVSEQIEDSILLKNATSKLEISALRLAPDVFSSTEGDRAAFSRAGIENQVIPHPIDLTSMVEIERNEAAQILEHLYDVPLRGRRLCFFVGSAYEMNAQAARAVRKMAQGYSGQDCLFVVAGKCMDPVQEDNFIALGRVDNAALCALYSAADIALVPLLKGTGSSIKSIEALAYGCPILSTSVGMRGIPVSSGVHCVIEDDLSLYPQVIAGMLADEGQQNRLREASRAFGAAYHYEKVFESYEISEKGADTSPQPMGREDSRRRVCAELLARALLNGDEARIRTYQKKAGVYAQAVIDAHERAKAEAVAESSARTEVAAESIGQTAEGAFTPAQYSEKVEPSAGASGERRTSLSAPPAGGRPSFLRRAAKSALLSIPHVRHIYQQLLIANKRVETLGQENNFVRSALMNAERLERKFEDHQNAMAGFTNRIADLAAETAAKVTESERRLEAVYARLVQSIEKVEDVDTGLRIVENSVENIARELMTDIDRRLEAADDKSADKFHDLSLALTSAVKEIDRVLCNIQEHQVDMAANMDARFAVVEDQGRAVAEKLSDRIESATTKGALRIEQIAASLSEVRATFLDYKSGLQNDLQSFQRETAKSTELLTSRVSSNDSENAKQSQELVAALNDLRSIQRDTATAMELLTSRVSSNDSESVKQSQELVAALVDVKAITSEVTEKISEFGLMTTRPDYGEENSEAKQFEVLRDQAERAIFVIGAPRSATTITANLINSTSNAFMLAEANLPIEEKRRLAGEGDRFRPRYNNKHVENLNQPSKSSYLPDLLGVDEAPWLDHLLSLAEEYQHFGEKLALTTYHFSEVSPNQTMVFFERHFFSARYIFTLRNPRDSLASMTKLFNVKDVRTLSYYAIAWLSMIRLWSEWVRVFPHTLSLQCDEFDAGHAKKIADFIGLDIDPDLIDQSRRASHAKLPAACAQLMDRYGEDLESIYELITQVLSSTKSWQKEYKRTGAESGGKQGDRAVHAEGAASIGLVWLETSRIIEKMEKDLVTESANA